MLSNNSAWFFSIFIATAIYAGISTADQICRDTIPSSTPTDRFTVNNNGTVSDTATGLMWKRCAEGQSGSSCAGAPSSFSWQDALLLQSGNQESFAGFNDWRLPNVKELLSLVEVRCFDPAINLAVFQNASSSIFWSNSPVNKDIDVYVVDLSSGRITDERKSSGLSSAWLVRDL